MTCGNCGKRLVKVTKSERVAFDAWQDYQATEDHELEDCIKHLRKRLDQVCKGRLPSKLAKEARNGR